MGMFSSLIFSIVFIGLVTVQACPPRRYCALRLSCGSHRSIATLYNVEKYTGVIIDTVNARSLVFDGQAEKQILYDHKRKAGVLIIKGGWKVKKCPIETFVKSINSLKDYSKSLENIQKFHIKTASDDIISVHRSIMLSLEPEMTDFAEYKKNDILSISLNLFEELSKVKNDRLNEIFEKKFEKTHEVYGGLMHTISVLRGLSSMLKETKGSIETSILKPSFDLQPVFKSECGSEAMAVILDQTEKTSEMKDIVYSGATYNIIREFNGGQYIGLRGIEAFIYHLIQFSKNRVSLEVLIDVLIQVTASIKYATYEMIIEKVRFIKKIITTKLSSSQLLIVHLDAFLDDKLIVNNVNINNLVKIYLQKSSFGIDNVVSTLHHLQTNFYASLSVLFKRISFFILTAQAPFYIIRLMPNLKASLHLNVGISPISQITNLLNPAIFLQMLEGNFEVMIKTIPVLGSVFEEITRTLPSVHGSKALWIKEMRESDSLQPVVGWLKFGMSIEGGMKPVGCVHEMGLWGLDHSSCPC